MMQMIGSFAEFERAMIRERTLAALAAARAEGRTGGRRKKLDAAKRQEIAESVITGRKSGADKLDGGDFEHAAGLQSNVEFGNPPKAPVTLQTFIDVA